MLGSFSAHPVNLTYTSYNNTKHSSFFIFTSHCTIRINQQHNRPSTQSADHNHIVFNCPPTYCSICSHLHTNTWHVTEVVICFSFFRVYVLHIKHVFVNKQYTQIHVVYEEENVQIWVSKVNTWNYGTSCKNATAVNVLQSALMNRHMKSFSLFCQFELISRCVTCKLMQETF